MKSLVTETNYSTEVKWVNAKTALKIFSVGKNTLKDWADSGKIRRSRPNQKAGSSVLYRYMDIADLIEEASSATILNQEAV